MAKFKARTKFSITLFYIIFGVCSLIFSLDIRPNLKSVDFDFQVDTSVNVTNKENMVFNLSSVRSSLDCVRYCLLDDFCQTVTFEPGSRSCQGHSFYDSENKTAVENQDSRLTFDAVDKCELILSVIMCQCQYMYMYSVIRHPSVEYPNFT